jgi:hypothetical protein
MVPSSICVEAQYEYAHEPEKRVIVGGLVPDGDNGILADNGQKLCGWENRLARSFYVADFASGRIDGFPVDGTRSGVSLNARFQLAQGAPNSIVSLRMGPGDAMHVVRRGGFIDSLYPEHYKELYSDENPCVNYAPTTAETDAGVASPDGATVDSGSPVGDADVVEPDADVKQHFDASQDGAACGAHADGCGCRVGGRIGGTSSGIVMMFLLAMCFYVTVRATAS